MHAIRYTILEIRYSRPPRITARDEHSGRTAVFTWPIDVHPTQSELARIFSESVDASDAGSLAENRSRSFAADRRRFFRICHSFEGRRRGILTVPIRIYDLSVGGCLIESRYPESRGRRLELDIDLPWEGWTTLDAQIVNIRPEYGYGVQFVGVPEDIRRRLDRVVERIGRIERNRSPERNGEILETTERELGKSPSC
jgi:PilZ domain-containing protein